MTNLQVRCDVPFIALIPARYASTRFPGKPLCDVAGRPMIQWVWERARQSGASQVIVATDDDRIREVCVAFGADVQMTSSHHLTGTDRLAEVADLRKFATGSIIVNVQGDEPQIPPAIIRDVALSLHENAGSDIATAVAPVTSLEEFLDPDCVKALRALDGTALYFSRAAVPWPRDDVVDQRPASFHRAWRHIGLYAYRLATLQRMAAWAPTPLEQLERLEQLRALEHGMSIFLLALPAGPPAGIDTPEDLQRLIQSLARADVGSGNGE